MMKVNFDKFGPIPGSPLYNTGSRMFGYPSDINETREEKIQRAKLKHGLVHGKGLRKKKYKQKRKKEYGKNK